MGVGAIAAVTVAAGWAQGPGKRVTRAQAKTPLPAAPAVRMPRMAPASQGAGPLISLAQALRLAQANSPQFQMAVEQAGSAKDNQTIARAALLPSVNFNNGYLYTQGGTGVPVPRFIANNWVHEYISQGWVHENLLGGGLWPGISRAGFAAVVARDQLEVARRGLRLTVTAAYYGVLSAEARARAARQGVAAAARFHQLSQELQQGGEVARADVIKAELQLQTARQAERQARLAAEQARLGLAVLLFPRPTQPFRLANTLAAAPPLPAFGRLQKMAGYHNPQLGAALAALHVAKENVAIARDGYLPSLSFDYWYGIDAEHFAVRAPNDANPNAPALGSAAEVTLNIPVWNWGATGARLDQAKLARRQAQVQLSYAQRFLIAQLQADYDVAVTARRQLRSFRRAERLAEESLHLTDLRYQAAVATALEVVNAQDSLVTARNNLANGEAQYHTALATLQTLTGTF